MLMFQRHISSEMEINILDASLPHSWIIGSCGFYKNSVYLINGMNCSFTECDIFTSNLQYTLDVSSIRLSNDSKSIHLASSNHSWVQSIISPPPLSYALGTHASGSIYLNDKIYIIHPNYETNNYSLQYSMNAQNNQYLSLNDYSWDISRSTLLRDACTTHNYTHIFSIGGVNMTNDTVGSVSRCDVYQITSDSWTQINNLNIRRHNAACATLNDTVYVFGGQTTYSDDKKLNSIEAYNTTSDQWVLLNVTLNAKRAGHACITHLNRQWIICFGGFGRMSLKYLIQILWR